VFNRIPLQTCLFSGECSRQKLGPSQGRPGWEARKQERSFGYVIVGGETFPSVDLQ
jgi:hypothetical protein